MVHIQSVPLDSAEKVISTMDKNDFVGKIEVQHLHKADVKCISILRLHF